MIAIVALLIALVAAGLLLALATRRLRHAGRHGLHDRHRDRWAGYHLPALAATPCIIGAAVVAASLDLAAVTGPVLHQRVLAMCIVVPATVATVACGVLLALRGGGMTCRPLQLGAWLVAALVPLVLVPIQRLGFLDAELMLVGSLGLLWMTGGIEGAHLTPAEGAKRVPKRERLGGVASAWGLAMVVGLAAGVAASSPDPAMAAAGMATVGLLALALVVLPGCCGVAHPLRGAALVYPLTLGLGLGLALLARIAVQGWLVTRHDQTLLDSLLSISYLLAFEPPTIDGYGEVVRPAMAGLVGPVAAAAAMGLVGRRTRPISLLLGLLVLWIGCAMLFGWLATL